MVIQHNKINKIIVDTKTKFSYYTQVRLGNYSVQSSYPNWPSLTPIGGRTPLMALHGGIPRNRGRPSQ